ncbi:permease prefix domain 1-containing protein [Demequina soli]|uniref:permease prefix domain 1-containing protein n=1 Tax=Demequina soli TaxID=1638987 RepID=UPI0007840C3B|nr:permease prefix domain 1-containing protein [Demequina soli]
MSAPGGASGPTVRPDVEAEITRWRAYLDARGAVAPADADELEDHLRGQVEDLMASGLSDEEAFLVAVKRLGSQDEVAREFARQHSKRLWRQLVLDGGPRTPGRWGAVPGMLGFAVAAALATRAPSLVLDAGDDAARYVLLSVTLVLGVVAGFLAWRRASRAAGIAAAVATVAGAALTLAYPFDATDDTVVLALLHLPIALWLVVGFAYAGGRWRSRAARLDFIRFTGEWVIYVALIAAGGGVLVGVTLAVFRGLGIDAEPIVSAWVVPFGAGGATVVAAWLVEAKQEVLESIAPVLTRVFAPLATLALAAMLVAAVATGGFQESREVLIAVDVLLVVVLGLVLYSISALEPTSPAGWTDRLQLALVVAALALDAFALAAIAGRIGDAGSTPNRIAALGLNLVLLVNLAATAWLYGVRLARRGTLEPLLRWQTAYVPVYGAWALVVAVALPPLFAFA